MLKLIQDYNSLFNKSGILGFINSKEKKILILESSNLLNAVTRVLFDIKMDTYKSREFIKDFKGNLIDEVKLFYELDGLDYVTRYIFTRKLLDEYKDYKLYRPVKFTRYKITKELVHVGPDWLILVNLENYRNQITVGAFKTGLQVDRFINKYYPNNQVESLVYASNTITRDYLLNKI